MAERTGIEWTDHTWSPWWGCTKVSPACDHCYAEALDRRVGGAHWGPGVARRQMSDEHWSAPLRWDRAAAKAGVTRFVFPSMCDPFDNEVPAAWRDRFFALMRGTPNLTWLLLTKRIGNAVRLSAAAGELPRNAALGATVVTQDEFDRDIPKLVKAKHLAGARFIFLSVEPMLGPVDLGVWTLDLDWVICGGESGPRARPMHPDWARAIRDQCAAAANVPFFFKQWGEWVGGAWEDWGEETCFTPTSGEAIPDLRDRDRWHDRVHWFDDADHADGPGAVRIGRAAAGRKLDGVEHNARPEPVPC